jgi:hypothetical protein
MSATLRSSTLFTSNVTNKYVPLPSEQGGRIHPIYFEATIVSVSAASDTYDLFTVPAGWAVKDIFVTSNGLGASAGTGTTLIIGDSGDTDRLVASFDSDLVNSTGRIAWAGVKYTPTSDTVMECLIGTAAAVVGKVIKGYVELIPG